jgi:hypothetical protein
MRNISLWDDGIGNHTITGWEYDFPFNAMSLPLDSSPPAVFPSTPVLLITGLPGRVLLRKRQPKPKS